MPPPSFVVRVLVWENKCIFGHGNGMGGVRLSAIMKELGSLKMV